VKRENNITICLKQIGQKDVDGNVVEDRKSGELGENDNKISRSEKGWEISRLV
jgi:hypothetical protein